MTTKTFRVIGLLLALSFVSPGALAQSSQDTSAARALASQGVDAFQANDFEEALRLFTLAEQLVHALPHLLFMARSQAKLGHPVEAFELYNRIARDKLPANAPDAFVRAQRDAGTEIDAVEARIAQVTLTLAGPGAKSATLLVDGKALPAPLLGVKSPFNPGQHELSVSGDGVSAAPRTITVADGSSAAFSLDVALAPTAQTATAAAPPPSDEKAARSSRVPAYVAFGVAGAGVIVGAVFTIVHFDKSGKASSAFDDHGCEQGCTAGQGEEVRSLDRDAATAGTVALIGYGVGAAGLATGITLLLLEGPDKAEADAAARQTRMHVRPYVGFGELGLSGRF